MSDDQNQNPQTPIVSLPVEQQLAIAAHAKNVADLVEHGRQAHGTAAFDDASQRLVETLGAEKAQHFIADAMQFNAPDQVIMHLANNEIRLKKLATLPPAQRAVEIARIESEYASHGHVETGATPAWKTTHANKGRVSDADWAHSYGENLTTEQWMKEWDRRHAGEGRK